MADRTTDVRRSQGGRVISEPHRAQRRRLGTGARLLVSACVAASALVVSPPALGWAAVPSQADDASSVLDEDSPVGENPLLVDGPVVAAVATQEEGDATDTGEGEATDTGEAETDSVIDEGTGDATTDGAETDAVGDDDSTDGSNNDDAEGTVRLVMFALIGVAALLALLTVFYWWRTRPARVVPPARRTWDADESDTRSTDESQDRSTDASAPAEATGP